MIAIAHRQQIEQQVVARALLEELVELGAVVGLQPGEDLQNHVSEVIVPSGLAWKLLLEGAWEVVGAGLLGAAVGIPTAWMTGRAKPGEPTLLEALGSVLLCGGLASVLGVSYLLACMTLGAVVARRARHHTWPLHAIEGVSQPFLVVFFLLAGLEFDEVIFDIRCGTTVGALNISCLAAYADEPRSRVAWLDHVWSSPEVGSSSCLAAPLPRPRLYLMRSRGVGPGRRYDKGDC